MFNINDVRLFQFLRSAMDFKHGSGNWEKLSFRGIPFEPWINFWTQRVFLERRLPQYINLFKDRKVFDEAYKGLAFKPELKFLNNPQAIKDSPTEIGLPDQMHEQIAKEAEAINPAVRQEIYGSAAGPATTAAKSDLAPAQTTPTHGPGIGIPQPAAVGTIQPPTVETVQAEPQPQISQTPPPATPQASQPKEATRINIPKIPTQVSSAGSGFLSNAGIFFKKNFGKYLTAQTIATVFTSFLGGIIGQGVAGNGGMIAGAGVGALTPQAVKSGWITNKLGGIGNEGVNILGRFSNQVAGPRFSLPIPSSKGRVVALAFGGAMVLFLGVGLIGVILPGSPGTQPGQASPINNIIGSCPIPGGRITTPSYDLDPINGHCGKNYGTCPSDDPNIPGTMTRRAKSIDVVGGPDVYLPTIENQTLNWKYAGSLIIDPSDCESKDASGKCGIGLMFQANTQDGHTWTIHLIHMDSSLSSKFASSNQTYSSGTLLGSIAINHLHMTVGKDLQNITARYDPGWLASDFMCK